LPEVLNGSDTLKDDIMAFFKRKKKDKRIEDVTQWAKGYLESREDREFPPDILTPDEWRTERREGREDVIPIATPAPKSGVGEDTGSGSAPVTTVPAFPEKGEPCEDSIHNVPENPEEGEAGTEGSRDGEISALAREERKEVAASKPVHEEGRGSGIHTGFLQRLRVGLSRTRDGMVGRIDRLLSIGKKIDAATLEELEEILIESDLGVQLSLSLIQKIQEGVRRRDLNDSGKIRTLIRRELEGILKNNNGGLNRPNSGPYVIMVVGVNGVGKTTTIGKLARHFVREGESVILAAGDTFRAAAAEQLKIWGERVGADVVQHRNGSDPSAVVFDALKAAVSRGADVVIADTAGRLHTRTNLMEELKKMKRVMNQVIPGSPHEILLVLDATTGQNALSQAKTFHEAVGVTGIVLTKLDGTAKGGIVTAIVGELGLPVQWIGIGEAMDDLRNFEPEAFVGALFDD